MTNFLRLKLIRCLLLYSIDLFIFIRCVILFFCGYLLNNNNIIIITINRSLPDCQTLGTFALSPVVFDKDSDLSMRAVASIGNLRARNYRIPEIDLHRARGLAGNIIPAIATTTGLVAGTICLEIYKLAQKPLTGKAKTLEEYSNAFYNLAIPLFTSSHPEPPQWRETKIDEKIWKWNQVSYSYYLFIYCTIIGCLDLI